jgi:hypothetical protein
MRYHVKLAGDIIRSSTYCDFLISLDFGGFVLSLKLREGHRFLSQ